MLTSTHQLNYSSAIDGDSITAAALQTIALPPINWILPDLLPAGLTILAGSPKSGKSWLALELALSVASGADFLDQPTQAGTVIYYALEDSPYRIQARIKALLGNRPAPDAMHLAFALDHDQMTRELRNTIANHNPSLVIVDTIGRLGVKTTAHYDSVYTELTAIKSLADAAGIGILAVTHARKQPASDPFSRILGSTAQAGAVDTMWVLIREGSTDNAHLYITGRDVSQQDLRVRFENRRWRVVPDDANSQMVMATPLYQFVLQLDSYRGLTSSLCGDYILYCLSLGIDNNLSGGDINVSFGRQLRRIIPQLQAAGKHITFDHTKAGNLITITTRNAKQAK